MTADESHEILTKLYDKGFSIVENSEIESAKIQSLQSQIDKLKNEIEELLVEKEVRDNRIRSINESLLNVTNCVIAQKHHAEEMAKAIEGVNDWNKKYPPGRVYGYGRAKDIENELQSAIINAQQALTNFREGNKLTNESDNINKLVELSSHELFIQVNPHNLNNESVVDYFDDLFQPEDIDRSIMDEMIRRNIIVRIQAYPNNSTSFILIFHYDIQLAIEMTIESLTNLREGKK